MVYDTQLASVQKRLDTVRPVTTGDVEAEEPVTETETRQVVEAISSPSRKLLHHQRVLHQQHQQPAHQAQHLQVEVVAQLHPPAPTTINPAPSTPSTPGGGGGGGGYGGGY